MKTPSDELFLLIRSLEPQEKRCFKLYTSANKADSNFIVVFDAIDDLNTYDETKLISNLKKSGGIKNLKQVKSQLYDKIIFALSIYHNTHSIKRSIQNLIFYAELLIEKGLFKASMKYMLKAEMLALAHDQYEYLLIIDSLKISLIKPLQLNYDGAEFEKQTSLENKHVADIQTRIEYRNLLVQLEKIYVRYGDNLNNPVLLKEVERISRLPLVRSDKKAQTLLTKYYYYEIQNKISHLTEKWTYANYKLQLEFLNYIEESPQLLNVRAFRYINILSRIIIILIKIKRYKMIEAFFEKARTFYLALPLKLKSRQVRSDFIHSIVLNYMAAQLYILNCKKVIEISEILKGSFRLEMLDNNGTLVYNFQRNCSVRYTGSGPDQYTYSTL
jgi:hypothetical protein